MEAGQGQSEQQEWNQSGEKSPAVEIGWPVAVAEAAGAA